MNSRKFISRILLVLTFSFIAAFVLVPQSAKAAGYTCNSTTPRTNTIGLPSSVPNYIKRCLEDIKANGPAGTAYTGVYFTPDPVRDGDNAQLNAITYLKPGGASSVSFLAAVDIRVGSGQTQIVTYQGGGTSNLLGATGVPSGGYKIVSKDLNVNFAYLNNNNSSSFNFPTALGLVYTWPPNYLCGVGQSNICPPTPISVNIFQVAYEPKGVLTVTKHIIENGQYPSKTSTPPANARIQVRSSGTNDFGSGKSDNPATFSLSSGNYDIRMPAIEKWYVDYFRSWRPDEFQNINSNVDRDSGLVDIGDYGRRIDNIRVGQSKTTKVHVWYDPPPDGSFLAATCLNTTTSNPTIRLNGYAYDKSPTGYGTDISVYTSTNSSFFLGNATDGSAQQLVDARSANNPSPANVNAENGITGNHGYNFEISANASNGLNDGQTHYLHVVALNKNINGDRRGRDVVIGSKAVNCSSIPLYYPWLQTQKGDVISTGAIEGQDIGPFGEQDNIRGGRHFPQNTTIQGSGIPGQTTANPESFYVVAGKGTGQNFCSLQLYTLGVSSQNEREKCTTGGYSATKVDIASLGQAVDRVWKKNGEGNGTGASLCKPYNTLAISLSAASPPSIDASLGCVGGGLQKVKDGDFTLGTVAPVGTPTIPISVKGRGTIWVQGKLTINSNMQYETPAGPIAASQLPNLAIYVDGDIVIDQSVTRIDAVLIATGTINTCAQSGNTAANICNQRLVVNGYLASNGQIQFNRRYYVLASPNLNPAEQLLLTGQSIAFPPPGLSRSDSENDVQLQINSGELPPRLN